MEKILTRIHPVSDPEATYFLQVSWEKDLGSGFGVTLTDGQCAWTGTVSEAEISREAADMEMNREKYVEELKKALISGEESAGKYNFAISRDDENTDCHFSYERNLKDGSFLAKPGNSDASTCGEVSEKAVWLRQALSAMKLHLKVVQICHHLSTPEHQSQILHFWFASSKFRLGSLKLQKVSSPAEVVKELIGYCLDCLGKLQMKNEHLQKENERLFSGWSNVEKRLEKCVEAKEELEADLYNRFILVLNEKKAKIRNLQKLLNKAEESASHAKYTRDSIATTQMATGRENDYEGSTDEESENLRGASLRSAPERKDSFLSSPDVIDTGPRRKRRQRTAKSAGTGDKMATYETELSAKEKPDRASQKTLGKHWQDVMSLETLENTCEPEDLFDDI